MHGHFDTWKAEMHSVIKELKALPVCFLNKTKNYYICRPYKLSYCWSMLRPKYELLAKHKVDAKSPLPVHQNKARVYSLQHRQLDSPKINKLSTAIIKMVATALRPINIWRTDICLKCFTSYLMSTHMYCL